MTVSGGGIRPAEARVRLPAHEHGASELQPTLQPVCGGNNLNPAEQLPAQCLARHFFPNAPAPSMIADMNDVSLPPELERFAAEAVASGRYRNRADLVVAGLSLLQRQEATRAELLASVLSAKKEADRDGYLTGDEVATRVQATIARRSNASA